MLALRTDSWLEVQCLQGDAKTVATGKAACRAGIRRCLVRAASCLLPRQLTGPGRNPPADAQSPARTQRAAGRRALPSACRHPAGSAPAGRGHKGLLRAGQSLFSSFLLGRGEQPFTWRGSVYGSWNGEGRRHQPPPPPRWPALGSRAAAVWHASPHLLQQGIQVGPSEASAVHLRAELRRQRLRQGQPLAHLHIL